MASGGTVGPTSLRAAQEAVANLESALVTRGVIGCAQGILMERYRLPPDAAMQVLRRLSMDRHVKVSALAEAIVAGDPDVLPRVSGETAS